MILYSSSIADSALRISQYGLERSAEAGCRSCGLPREIRGRMKYCSRIETFTNMRELEDINTFYIDARKDRVSQSQIIVIYRNHEQLRNERPEISLYREPGM